MESTDCVLSTINGEISNLREVLGNSEVGPIAVTVENSSDVIFGPVTQYHGPVTICQTVGTLQPTTRESSLANNGTLVKSESTASDVGQPTHKPHCVQYILILVLLTSALIFGCVLLLWPSKESPQEPELTTISTPNSPYIYRDRWGGRPPLNFTKSLSHPTKMVIIAHTATPFCKTFLHCASRVANIQSYHVGTLGSPDIGSNFLIGGDGKIYVGRDWDTVNYSRDDSIIVSIIGNYIYDSLTSDMIASMKKLLQDGVQLGKLSKDYLLVCHNQTFSTQSPGINVYEVVKHWPHFNPGEFMT